MVFGTATSFDFVGIGVTPQGSGRFNIGYERAEVGYVPDNGGAGHSVVGVFKAEGVFGSYYEINEKFATGQAAVQVANKVAKEDGEEVEEKSLDIQKPLIFTTATRWGMHALIEPNSPSPVNVDLGYRRYNLAYVPVSPNAKDVRSVYADISASSATKTTPERPGGYRIDQVVATGEAAVILARNRNVVNSFAIELALKEFNANQHQIDTLKQLMAKIPEADRGAVYDQVQQIGGTRPSSIQEFNLLIGSMTSAQREKLLPILQALVNK